VGCGRKVRQKEKGMLVFTLKKLGLRGVIREQGAKRIGEKVKRKRKTGGSEAKGWVTIGGTVEVRTVHFVFDEKGKNGRTGVKR